MHVVLLDLRHDFAEIPLITTSPFSQKLGGDCVNVEEFIMAPQQPGRLDTKVRAGSDSASQLPAELLFINVGNTEARPSKETRTLVRKHVMHNTTRRRKALEQISSRIPTQNVRRLAERPAQRPTPSHQKLKRESTENEVDEVLFTSHKDSLGEERLKWLRGEESHAHTTSRSNLTSTEPQEMCTTEDLEFVAEPTLPEEWYWEAPSDITLVPTGQENDIRTLELARARRRGPSLIPLQLDPYGFDAAHVKPSLLEMTLIERYVSIAASTVARYLMPLSRKDASQARQDEIVASIKSIVIGHAVESAALYHALLLLPLLDNTGWHVHRATAQASYHTSEATRLIKEALGSEKDAISDGIIAAVAFIAGYENLMENHAARKIHIQGLQRLINMRGGVKSLRTTRLLQSRVNQTEETPTFATGQNLLLPLIEFPYLIASPVEGEALADPKFAFFRCPTALTVPTGLELFVVSGQFSGDIVTALQELTFIMKLSNWASTHALSERVQVSWDRRVESVMSLLKSAIFNGTLSTSDGRNVEECLRLALLAYCETYIQESPLSSCLAEQYATELKSLLRQTRLLDSWVYERQLVLWIILMVGVSVVGRPLQTYYTALLLKTCQNLDIHTWEQVEPILERFIWMGSRSGRAGRDMILKVTLLAEAEYESSRF